MRIKKALASLPLVLNACSGDTNDTSYTPNKPGAGIWKGGFSAGQISTTTSASGAVTDFEPTGSEGVGLYTSDNRVFFYNVGDGVLFTNDVPGISNGTLYYSPDYYMSDASIDTVSITANVYTSSSISGQYTGTINGYFVMQFDHAYFRGADLSRLTGNWEDANTGWSYSITADGSFNATHVLYTGCTLSGSFSTIDHSKNEYAISATMANCSGSYLSYNGTDYSGLAANIDTIVTDDTILMAVYNVDHGFFSRLIKQ